MRQRPNPVFRPATREDIDNFYPEATQTFKAIVAELDGKPLGIGGIYYSNGTPVAFSKTLPELEKYPFTIARGAKMVMEFIGDKDCVAFADESLPGAPEFLERLGFQHVRGNT